MVDIIQDISFLIGSGKVGYSTNRNAYLYNRQQCQSRIKIYSGSLGLVPQIVMWFATQMVPQLNSTLGGVIISSKFQDHLFSGKIWRWCLCENIWSIAAIPIDGCLFVIWNWTICNNMMYIICLLFNLLIFAFSLCSSNGEIHMIVWISIFVGYLPIRLVVIKALFFCLEPLDAGTYGPWPFPLVHRRVPLFLHVHFRRRGMRQSGPQKTCSQSRMIRPR